MKAMLAVAADLYVLPGFQKHDLESQDSNSNTAIIKFDGRYPEKRGFKTRNLVANMSVLVLKGSVLLGLLEGKGNVYKLDEGSMVTVPSTGFYIWHAQPKVVILNLSTPAWTEGQQEKKPMTYREMEMLRGFPADIL